MADTREASTTVTPIKSDPASSPSAQAGSTTASTDDQIDSDQNHNHNHNHNHKKQQSPTRAAQQPKQDPETDSAQEEAHDQQLRQESQATKTTTTTTTEQPATSTTPPPPPPSTSTPTPVLHPSSLVAEDSQSRDTAVHSRKSLNGSDSIQETYQPSSINPTTTTTTTSQQNSPQSQPPRNGHQSIVANGTPQGLPPPHAQGVKPLQQQQQQQRPQPMIRLRVLSIEKAGRDLIVRMDSMVNHPAYRLSSYSFSRSYRELSLFTLALSLSLPSVIIPFLPFLPPPLSTSSSHNASLELDSDLKSLRLHLSTWFNRLLNNPLIFNHPELRSLIETEFSYLPSLNPSTSNFPSPLARKKLSNAIDLHQHGGSVNPLAIADLGYGYDSIPTSNHSSSSLPGGIGMGSSVMNQLFSSSNTVSNGGSGKMGTSRNVFDDDELLVAARAEVTRLELQFKDAGQAIGKRSAETLSLSSSLHQLSSRFLNLTQVEELRPASSKVGFPKGLEAVGRGVAIEGVGDERESSLDLHHLSHALLYQSLNARSAKEALLTRNALVEEHHNASKAVIARRREIDVLRSSRSIRRERVDEKVEELEEAIRLEKILDDQLKFLSKSLSSSLQNHSRETHKDLMESLKKHSSDRLKTNKEILVNLKVMKEGLARVGKDWSSRSTNHAVPGGMVRKISRTGSNGYGYQQQPTPVQSIENQSRVQPNRPANSFDSSRPSPSGSISTLVPPVPVSAHEAAVSTTHSPALSREPSSQSQNSPFNSPQRSQVVQPPPAPSQTGSNFSSPSMPSSGLNPHLQNQNQHQTPPRTTKPNPWAPEGHVSPSNSFNQSPSSNRDSMNQSWYSGGWGMERNHSNQSMSKSMFVERSAPIQPSPSQEPPSQQQQQQQWNGMPTSSSFASRFGTLGTRCASGGPSSFGSGASSYGNPFASSGGSSPNGNLNNNNAQNVGPARPGLNSGGGGSFGSATGGLNRSRISASDAAKQLAGRF